MVNGQSLTERHVYIRVIVCGTQRTVFVPKNRPKKYSKLEEKREMLFYAIKSSNDIHRRPWSFAVCEWNIDVVKLER